MARIHIEPEPKPKPWPVTTSILPEQPVPPKPPVHVWYETLFSQAILPDSYSSYPVTFEFFACSECRATVTDRHFDYTNRSAHTQWHQDQERLINANQDSNSG
jgi:hypothetical protein